MPHGPFRIGIVGTGMITLGAHLPACLASPDVAVTALIDPVIERARQAAAKYGLRTKLARSIDDAFGEIDGAIIATPNNTHCDIALRCFEAGVDVLIEKPIAVTAEEGERIVDAARASGRVAAVGYSLRFRNNVQLLGSLLREGHFGRVTRFVHQFGTVGGWAPMSGYNLNRTTAGGGVLMVTGSHFIDRIVTFWGMPDRVLYADDSMGGPEANCEAEFFWETGPHVGLRGMGRYSKMVSLPGGMVIETEAGIVKLPDSEGNRIAISSYTRPDLETYLQYRAGHERFSPAKSAAQLQLEDFVEACRSRRTPMVDAAEGLASQRLLERLYLQRTPLDARRDPKPETAWVPA